MGNQIALASGALVTLNADGTFSYNPNNQFESTRVGATDSDSFTYVIDDGNGGTNGATVNITINGVNDNPVADAVHDNVVEDGPAVMGNMFINTSDVDDLTTFTIEEVAGSALAVGVLQNRPSGATVLIEANGDYTYDPAGGYQSLAENATTQEMISVLVANLTGLNDGPDARDDAFGISEDDGPFNDSVFVNNGSGADTDPDSGDTFTVTAVNGATGDVGNQITLTSGALLTLNSDGTFTYDINDAFEFLSDDDPDTDSFTYTISDALGLMDTATINITGDNDDPVAVDDSFSVIVADDFTGNVLTGVGSAADSDIDQNDTLSVTDINGNTGALGTNFVLPSGATVNMLSTGGFTYDSAGAGFSAPTVDSFTYGISDGNGGTDVATVSVTIQPPGNTASVVSAILDQFLEDEVSRQTDLLDPTAVSDADLDDLDVANAVVMTEDLRALVFTLDEETGLFSIGDGSSTTWPMVRRSTLPSIIM